jgi:hypothetical protein
MKNQRIIICRHAESIEDIDNNIYDVLNDLEIPLTEKGIQQAQNFGAILAQLLEKIIVLHIMSKYYRTCFSVPFYYILLTLRYLSVNIIFTSNRRERGYDWKQTVPKGQELTNHIFIAFSKEDKNIYGDKSSYS